MKVSFFNPQKARAAEGGISMRKSLMLSWVCLLIILTAGPLWAADAPVTTAPSGGKPEASLTEINKKLTNPVSDLWSIAFQQNNYILDMGPGKIDHWNSNLNFQPVLPVALTSNWNLITRPVSEQGVVMRDRCLQGTKITRINKQ
jgi:hypothetical protein